MQIFAWPIYSTIRKDGACNWKKKNQNLFTINEVL